MKKLLCAVVLVGLFFSLTGGRVMAAASPEEAKAMVEKALELFKTDGQAKAAETINDPNGGFQKGELYTFMFGYDGLCIAHQNAKLVGKNLSDLEDAAGKHFIVEMADMAKKGGGWVDYRWSNPETKKMQDKTSFVMPVPGKDIYIGCGYYK